jgi:AcrR family transcriptional regulator
MNSQDGHVDLRVRRTRKLLWEALLDLIAEKDFESITVRELCERAMVHRTTFYNHYLDKYDLLEQGIQAMYDDLLVVAPLASEAPANFAWDTPPETLIAVFDHITGHRKLYERMLSHPGVNTFRNLLRDYLRDYVTMRMDSVTPVNPEVPESVMIHFTVGAMLELITGWIESDWPYTSRDLALYTMRLIAYGLYPAIGIDRRIAGL